MCARVLFSIQYCPTGPTPIGSNILLVPDIYILINKLYTCDDDDVLETLLIIEMINVCVF